MSKPLVLAFAALTACATQKSTTPVTPVPDQPTPGTCQASAEVIFTIEQKTDTPDQHATSTFRIYSSGYWLFDEKQPGGTPGRKLDGCVTDGRLGKLVTTLDAAPWTMSRADMTCMAYSPQFVDYEVSGRHVWQERMCGPEQLDDKSKQALGEARELVKQLVPEKAK